MQSSAMAFWGPVLIAIAAISFFVAFIYGLIRFFRWLWGRLPSTLFALTPEGLDKPLGVLLALGLFPPLIRYAWQTTTSLLDFLSRFSAEFMAYGFATNCPPALADACAVAIAQSTGNFISRSTTSLMEALNLRAFPIVDFIWFLLVAVIAIQIVGFVRREMTAGRLSAWWGYAGAFVPRQLRQRIVFTVLVLLSFYLGLSALLAIPLFQDRSRADQLTAEALGKALDVNILKQDVFDTTYPLSLPKLQDVSAPEPPDNSVARFRRKLFDLETQRQSGEWDELQGYWVSLRTAVFTEQASARDRAKLAFDAGLQRAGGRRPATLHSDELREWHQRVTAQGQEALSSCREAAGRFVITARQSLLQSRDAVLAATGTGIGPASPGFSRSVGYFEILDQAKTACSVSRTGVSYEVPQRPTFSRILGAIGNWTGWLVDTELMAVVIIVGLVGFSLLGATVSRAVRIREERSEGGLTFDDLLLVIAGGTTAAVVVFLAAYGGLAVLGETAGDPNPYVVFATCLIGAVYSEDVWKWARTKLPREENGGQQGELRRESEPERRGS